MASTAPQMPHPIDPWRHVSDIATQTMRFDQGVGRPRHRDFDQHGVAPYTPGSSAVQPP